MSLSRLERYERDFGEFADYVRGFVCCICRGIPTQAHHVRSRGAGGRKEENLVPLCGQCHYSLHSIGVKTFERRHSVDLAEVAKEIWRLYGEKGDSL